MTERPPFRADHVGSLLRPAALRRARARYARGEIDLDALALVEDAEILRVVERQEDLGLQAVTDGEFRRSWWHLDFLWGLDGVGKHLTEQGVRFAGQSTRAEGVRVDAAIGFSGHPMLGHFAHLRDHSTRMPKVTIPAPSALYGRPVLPPIDRGVYPDNEQLFADLGEAYRLVVRAFADAGCRYLQLDEVFIAMLCDASYREQMRARGDEPEALTKKYAELINVAIADIPVDMTITLHLCRGNFRSTFMGQGGYDAVQEVLFNEIDVHGYFLEYDDERSGGFEPLRHVPVGKKVALGVVTTKHGDLESRDLLRRRIDAAARFVDMGQLCLAPQCGFASTEEGNLLSEDDQWRKLERIVEVAREVWS
jgi:5-methyltetrahydropteroyltriglutamate--homocysteine methyltransferase